MKNITKIIMLSAGMLLFAITSSKAQGYVRSIPVHKETVRPRQPSVQYIWFPDDWEYVNKKYELLPGRWMVPPQSGLKWAPGKWEHNASGYKWIRGKWHY